MSPGDFCCCSFSSSSWAYFYCKLVTSACQYLKLKHMLLFTILASSVIRNWGIINRIFDILTDLGDGQTRPVCIIVVVNCFGGVDYLLLMPWPFVGNISIRLIQTSHYELNFLFQTVADRVFCRDKKSYFFANAMVSVCLSTKQNPQLVWMGLEKNY